MAAREHKDRKEGENTFLRVRGMFGRGINAMIGLPIPFTDLPPAEFYRLEYRTGQLQ